MKKCVFLIVGALAINAFAELLVADPSVAYEDGLYFLVGTEPGHAGKAKDQEPNRALFPLYVSANLQDWKLAETVNGEGRLLAKADAFGKTGFWAPHLFRREGVWYFAYSCDFHWGIASSSRVEGPFRTMMVFPREKGFAIDPYIFWDDNGCAYAYYSGGDRINVVRLSKSMAAYEGEVVSCIVNDQTWERLPLEERYGELNKKFDYTGGNAFGSSEKVIEGPSVLKRHGKYVLFYSANDYRSPDYCVGVAVAESPVGPWRKLQDAPALWRAQTGLNGTGHGDVFFDRADAIWYVFHAHNSGIRIHPRRTGMIRLRETIGKDGWPRYEADPMTMRLL